MVFGIHQRSENAADQPNCFLCARISLYFIGILITYPVSATRRGCHAGAIRRRDSGMTVLEGNQRFLKLRGTMPTRIFSDPTVVFTDAEPALLTELDGPCRRAAAAPQSVFYTPAALDAFAGPPSVARAIACNSSGLYP